MTGTCMAGNPSWHWPWQHYMTIFLLEEIDLEFHSNVRFQQAPLQREDSTVLLFIVEFGSVWWGQHNYLSLLFVWCRLMAFMASARLGLVFAGICGKGSVLGNISCLLVRRSGSDWHKLYMQNTWEENFPERRMRKKDWMSLRCLCFTRGWQPLLFDWCTLCTSVCHRLLQNTSFL